MQHVIFQDLGRMDYQGAWNYQEALLKENVRIKTDAREALLAADGVGSPASDGVGLAGQVGAGSPAQGEAGSPASGGVVAGNGESGTTNYLLFVEHPPVYTLGKSGHAENILINNKKMAELGVEFFRTNRGGDITFHGPGQLVGYPILDLEKFRTDLGWYLRSLEEVGIRVLAEYGLHGDRSPGETGIWIEPGVKGRERKICAMGVRCSRWITMHGFALNINTDLKWFGDIIPCGIPDKKVTSLEKELGHVVDEEDVKARWKARFEEVFGAVLV